MHMQRPDGGIKWQNIFITAAICIRSRGFHCNAMASEFVQSLTMRERPIRLERRIPGILIVLFYNCQREIKIHIVIICDTQGLGSNAL